MSAAPPDQKDLFERLKELEHVHVARPGRSRLRSGLAPGDVAPVPAPGRPATGDRAAHPRPPGRCAAPAPGQLAVTMVGHATVQLTTSRDPGADRPLFRPFPVGPAPGRGLLPGRPRRQRGRPGAAVPRPPGPPAPAQPAPAAPLGGAGGPARLRRSGRAAGLRRGPCSSPAPSCASATWRSPPWPSVTTAGGVPGICAGGAPASYLVRAPAVSALFVGDSGYFSGFRDLGRRMRPDVALLPIAGYEPLALRETHMSPLDAVAAFEDLGARPAGSHRPWRLPAGLRAPGSPPGVADPAVPAAGPVRPPGRAGARRHLPSCGVAARPAVDAPAARSLKCRGFAGNRADFMSFVDRLAPDLPRHLGRGVRRPAGVPLAGVVRVLGSLGAEHRRAGPGDGARRTSLSTSPPAADTAASRRWI